jgi:U3 small nucleolar RNA-associated protein 15
MSRCIRTFCSQDTILIDALLTSSQPDETHVAVGMSDGTLSVRRRQPKASETSEVYDRLLSLKSGAFESFLSVDLSNVGQRREKDKGKAKLKAVGDTDEFRVESRRKKRLREYDKFLKSFKYSSALDSVLRKVVLSFVFIAFAHR